MFSKKKNRESLLRYSRSPFNLTIFLSIFKGRFLDILSVIFIDQGMRKHVKIIDGEPLVPANQFLGLVILRF